VHALKSAWKFHLPPAPLTTPKHEHKHVDEMPLLNASDSRTLSFVSCSSFRSGGKQWKAGKYQRAMQKAERSQQNHAMRGQEWFVRGAGEWKKKVVKDEVERREIEEGWESVQRKRYDVLA
jgi:hypothetical protein